MVLSMDMQGPPAVLDNDQARAINRVKTEAAIHSWARFPAWTLNGGKYGQTGGEDLGYGSHYCWQCYLVSVYLICA